jgi:transposase InsO family protein
MRALLTGAGFTDVTLDDLAEPMYFGSDPDDAARFISGLLADMLHELDPRTRERAVDALREDMAAHHSDRGVSYSSAAWLVRARRPDSDR